MPAERAGYTVTMFLVDISSSMGDTRIVELPPGPNGEERTREMTNLEWSLQFVKLKIQEMIYNGRKTDQCGVIVFGSEETKNVINEANGGYENVQEYIKIAQPNVDTLARIDALEPSNVTGDPIDALIVAIETQTQYLGAKKTWTRKIILLTDGQNPIEIEDWEATIDKMDSLGVSLTVIGVDFDDEELPYYEEDKSDIKRTNEEFFHTFTSKLTNGIVGTCALALQETTRPDIKITKSTLMPTVLRLGDVDTRADEALEITVKTSKCTAVSRAKSWKKFGIRLSEEDGEVEVVDQDKIGFVQLKMKSEYFLDKAGNGDEDEDEDDVKKEEDDMKMDVDEDENAHKPVEKIDKEQLIRGFKYGTTYAPCPDGQFPKLPTKKGIDFEGFFKAKNFRRELSMSEIQYVWADPSSAEHQVALSSIVQGMLKRRDMAIARWVTKDGMDPKMGVLSPCKFDGVDCLLWSQMPFADDVRKYTFASLTNLVSKKGEVITEHPYIPTSTQMVAMDKFVDAMDLMTAGDKDEDGSRLPWFDPRLSYNPALHRTKQAMFHCAVVSDISTNPLPPPHPELLKFFEPPKKVVKKAQDKIVDCIRTFNVKEVPKRVTKARKDGHVQAVNDDDDDDDLLLDKKMPLMRTQSQSQSQSTSLLKVIEGSSKGKPSPKKIQDDSETEDESDDEDLLLEKKPTAAAVDESDKERPSKKSRTDLPTPDRSPSPVKIDLGRAPDRIIGTTYPLLDFKKNIAQGDVVSKAVEDLGYVIGEIVVQPFGEKRVKELIECLTTMRDVCVKEDEVDAWNEFLPKLKQTCDSHSGAKDLWVQVQRLGRAMSLISKKEAAEYGGLSSVSESEAETFLAE